MGQPNHLSCDKSVCHEVFAIDNTSWHKSIQLTGWGYCWKSFIFLPMSVFNSKVSPSCGTNLRSSCREFEGSKMLKWLQLFWRWCHFWICFALLIKEWRRVLSAAHQMDNEFLGDFVENSVMELAAKCIARCFFCLHICRVIKNYIIFLFWGQAQAFLDLVAIFRWLETIQNDYLFWG